MPAGCCAYPERDAKIGRAFGSAREARSPRLRGEREHGIIAANDVGRCARMPMQAPPSPLAFSGKWLLGMEVVSWKWIRCWYRLR